MKKLNSKDSYSILMESAEFNPGSWVERSIHVANCAKRIAEAIQIDADKAEAFGYIYDIGRRFGNTGLRHIIDGYNFMTKLEYEEAAKICLTHSFAKKDISYGIGKWDCTDEEIEFIKKYIDNSEYDIYDKIIQLCDSMALPNGCTLIERRLIDVDLRYGINDKTVENWKSILTIQSDIENMLGHSIYAIFPEVYNNITSNKIDDVLKIK